MFAYSWFPGFSEGYYHLWASLGLPSVLPDAHTFEVCFDTQHVSGNPANHWLNLTGPTPSFLVKRNLPEHKGWRPSDLLSTVKAEIPNGSLGCGFLPSFSFLRICALCVTAKGPLVACLHSPVRGNLKSAVRCAPSK